MRGSCGGWLGGCALLAAATALVLLGAAPGWAGAPGTGLSASTTTNGQLTSTYQWTIATTAAPGSQAVPVGQTGGLDWRITTTRSGSGTIAASLSGQVCVDNTGSLPTEGLSITDELTEPASSELLASTSVDVSAAPVLGPGASHCYPYTALVPAGSITAGQTYKDTARVTITNHAGHVGSPFGPTPSATVALPATPTTVNGQITVTDSNGKTFDFADSGSASYAQSVACASAEGAHTVSLQDTATISETGQQAKGSATVHCSAPTTLTTQLSESLIAPGGTASDQATIDGAQSGAAGTIRYAVYTTSDCSGTPFADATPASNAVSDGEAPVSKTITFPQGGTYTWQAVYSGDIAHNTLGSTSDCGDTRLTVNSWHDHDLFTLSQSGWPNGAPEANPILNSGSYDSIYASTAGVLLVGSTAGYNMLFTGASQVEDYLPASGTAGALTANLLNPTSTASGVFGGDVLALTLNVGFSDKGLMAAYTGPDFTPASSSLKFGDLTLCNFASGSDLNGLSVRQLLGNANATIGGLRTSDTPSGLDPIVAEVDGAFDAGVPDSFAQQHLSRDSSCQPASWQTGEQVTYTQNDWEHEKIPIFASPLDANYDTIYASTAGVLLAGSTAGYNMLFTGASQVEDYLPAVGPDGALTANLLNPTSTASGGFGGSVVALELNVDFADAGLMTGATGLEIGDLTLCNLKATPSLNGTKIRDFLPTANAVLGALNTPYNNNLEDIATITARINQSFEGGIVTPWAQSHLVNGTCP